MEGYLLIDKPTGWTSFDVVKYVRSMVARASGIKPKQVKVGHSGTLDPFASGLLIIFVGKKYTVQANDWLKKDKVYDVVIELGTVSTTGDPEGDLTSTNVEHNITKQNILAVFKQFIGDIEQTPPIYSAIKVNGVRAYKLARENKPVELSPRTVNIKEIKLNNFAYPIVEFRAEVSSGTYIRSLVEDMGNKLGCGAYTKELRRVSIANCSIDDATTIDNINEQTIHQFLVNEL